MREVTDEIVKYVATNDTYAIAVGITKMAKVNLFMQIKRYMKVNGNMTNVMVLENIIIIMAMNIQAIGEMIVKMVLEKWYFGIVINIMVNG